MKNIFLIGLSLIFFTSCSLGPEEEIRQEDYTSIVFSLAMTVDDIVKTKNEMVIDDKEAEDFVYVDEEFISKVYKDGLSPTEDPVGVYVMQLGDGFGIRIEGIYEGHISFDEDQLSKTLEESGLENVFVRFYACESTKEEDIYLCLSKACEDIGINIDNESLFNK